SFVIHHVFFFSSRRRHTRSKRDWSSDVCSSDLYSVHGDETSSGEAAMLTAYYLLANKSTETQEILAKGIVHIDPAQNPDGRDREIGRASCREGGESGGGVTGR